MKYTTEEYSELLDGILPCSTLEFELCDKLIDLKRELASNTEIIDLVSDSFNSLINRLERASNTKYPDRQWSAQFKLS